MSCHTGDLTKTHGNPGLHMFTATLIPKQVPTKTSKQPIITHYLGHVTGYQPIRDQYFLIQSVPTARNLPIRTCYLVTGLVTGPVFQLIRSVPDLSFTATLIPKQVPTKTSKQPIITHYLGHVTGYQPIRDQYFLIQSVPTASINVVLKGSRGFKHVISG
eukprot:sb/3472858/